MKKKLQQFLIFKFNSNHIRDKQYKINTTVEQARKNNELISVGESEVIRTLLRITGRDIDREELFKLEREKKNLKRKRRTEYNKQKLFEVEEKIKDMLFIPEIVNVQFSNKAHYRKIIKDGLVINGEKFTRLLAGAGNVRTNTVVFCKEKIQKELLEVLENGRNQDIELVPAKFNAYIALANSSTTPVSFPNFTVVSDAFISSERRVDYIPSNSNHIIEEDKLVEIELNSFDGQGLISPTLAKEWARNLGLNYVPASFIVRAPFVKGMVVTFDFHKFADDVALKSFIDDVYGNTVDVQDIDLILTESQFKMKSGYASVQEYIYKTKENQLGFGISRVSPKIDKSYVRSNYQFLQVLDLDDNQVEGLCLPTVEWFNDLAGEDPDKMLIYLLGSLTNDFIDSETFENLDPIVQALIIDRDVANDPYIRGRFLNSLSRKIRDSYLGKLIFEGNYSFLVSDPYAQAEHIFGLDIKGLLGDGEHFSHFWNERNVEQVVACRPPLTYQSEVNVLDFKTEDILYDWFKYINSGIVIPAGGIGIDVVLFADADHDGDIIATFSSQEFLDGVQGGNPIAYDKSSASKKKIDSSDIKLGKTDMQSFNSKIGYITNVSSSLYCLQSAYDSSTDEYKEIENRLKLCRKFQGDAIDAGKGIKIEPFPEHFVNKQGFKSDMSAEEISQIEFENNLVADKRPYYFKYLYSHYARRYKKYHQKFDNYCIIKFGIGIDDVLSKNILSEEQLEVVNRYYEYSFFMFHPSVMNRVCWFMEYSVPEIRKRSRNTSSNFFMYMNRNMPTDKDDVKKMEKLYRFYKSHKTSLHKNNDNKNSSFDNIGQFIEHIRGEAFLISNNVRYLANLAVEVCYVNHGRSSTEFVWKCFGDGIISNMYHNKMKRDDNFVQVPMIDKNGDIEYLWDNYSLREYDLNELI